MVAIAALLSSSGAGPAPPSACTYWDATTGKRYSVGAATPPAVAKLLRAAGLDRVFLLYSDVAIYGNRQTVDDGLALGWDVGRKALWHPVEPKFLTRIVRRSALRAPALRPCPAPPLRAPAVGPASCPAPAPAPCFQLLLLLLLLAALRRLSSRQRSQALKAAGLAPNIVPRAPKGRPAGASELELAVEIGLRQVRSSSGPP